MEVLKSKTDEVVFLYKLKEGKCLDSWGGHCAELAGVPPEILKRGECLPSPNYLFSLDF